MDETERKKWDQLENEPDRAYARFLVYLHLGPGRSIEKAYQSEENGRKRKSSSGTWNDDSANYLWVERAAAFDVEKLSERGAEVVVNWVQAIIGLSRMALEEVESGKHRPRNVEQLLEVVNVLSSFITPEVIEASRDMAGGDFGKPKETGGD